MKTAPPTSCSSTKTLRGVHRRDVRLELDFERDPLLNKSLANLTLIVPTTFVR